MATSPSFVQRRASRSVVRPMLAGFVLLSVALGSCTSDSTPETTVVAESSAAPVDTSPTDGSLESVPAESTATSVGTPVATSDELLPAALESAGPFSVMTSLLAKSGLGDQLKSTGPFTVFAPTDEAFTRLPPEIVARLQLPENLTTLESVLKYHVIGGSRSFDAIVQDDPDTLEGSKINIVMKDGLPLINGARIVAADVPAANGIIQGIDFVLLPPTVDLAKLTGDVDAESTATTIAKLSILQTLTDDGNFTDFLALAELAGVSSNLEGPGPITVFAPDNEALNRVPADTLRKLKLPQNKAALVSLLKHHIIAKQVNGRTFVNNTKLTMLDGTTITVKIRESKIDLDSTLVTFADQDAGNGVIHTVDSLIVPTGLDLAALPG